MSWLSSASKKVFGTTGSKILNPINPLANVVDRFLDKRIGIDDPTLRNLLSPATLASRNNKDAKNANGLLEPLDPLEPFSLPTNFELSSARGELQSVLRKKRARAKVSFTGGLQGGAGVAPRLTTA